MDIQFRRTKVGFVNLLWSVIKGQEKAVEASEKAKAYLRETLGVDIVELGEPVASREQAVRAWKLCKAEDVDALILYNGTYSTGEIAVEIIRNLDCPLALWGIGELGLESQDVSGSMIGLLPAGTFCKNINRKFSFIYGDVALQEVQEKLSVFIKAASAVAYLEEAKIAVIGVRPDGFEISDFDEFSIKAKFGTEITKLSLYSFSKFLDEIGEREIDEDMEVQKRLFSIDEKYLDESRELSRIYLALKKYTSENNIRSFAAGCWPEFRNREARPFCTANGRLCTEGIMAACEADVDGSLTMMLQYVLSGGEAPWWADFCNIHEDCLTWWHCGNAPYCNSCEKPVIDRVYEGLAQNASMRAGTATVCRLNSIRGEYTLHAGVGEVVDKGVLLKGSNMSIRMKGGNMKYVESLLYNGIPHHTGLVYGDIMAELEEFARLMDIPFIDATK